MPNQQARGSSSSSSSSKNKATLQGLRRDGQRLQQACRCVPVLCVRPSRTCMFGCACFRAQACQFDFACALQVKATMSVPCGLWCLVTEPYGHTECRSMSHVDVVTDISLSISVRSYLTSPITPFFSSNKPPVLLLSASQVCYYLKIITLSIMTSSP